MDFKCPGLGFQNSVLSRATGMAAPEDRSEGGNGAGVLLYYKYAPVQDISFLVRFYDSNCRSLALLGRVRIAPSGVNVTVSPFGSLRQAPLFAFSFVAFLFRRGFCSSSFGFSGSFDLVNYTFRLGEACRLWRSTLPL